MFYLGQKSARILSRVHPDLAAVVRRAIQSTAIDFTVLEGLRSEDRQRALVQSGASQTMNSRHRTGHAVDLGALDRGSVSWHWPHYFALARAMQSACRELEIPIIWGGCWDRRLADIGDPEDAQAEYVIRIRARNRKPFLDGPHFELARTAYP